MIIGQFNDSFPPITDGVASVTLHYAEEMGRRFRGTAGKSYVVTPAYPNFEDHFSDIEVIRYPSLPFSFRPPYRVGLPDLDARLMKQLNAIPFDLVHAQCPFGSGLLAQRIARARNIPLITSLHSKYYDDICALIHSEVLAKRALKTLMRIYEQATEVWTVNNSTIQTLREYGYDGVVRVIHNGTDMPKADPAQRRGPGCAAVCRELGLAEDVPLLLFIGQHIWQKNLRLMIEALDILKRRCREETPGRQPFQMLFVGSGDAEDELKALVQKLNLGSEVRFMGVIRDRDRIRALFERADLFLFPSLYDTSALTMREAAGVLCPLVMIEGSTTAEGITDGDNGYLSANTPEAYAERVYQALTDEEGRLRVGLRAQESLYRTWEAVGEDVYREYQRVIEAHH